MSLPPSARVKFVHTHPGGNPLPRRPPRHPSSSSIRSRSLELLDPKEKKVVLSVARNPLPLPRPRSRSLDGLIDEDDIIADLKDENLASINNSSIESESNIKARSQSLNEFLENANKKFYSIQLDNRHCNKNPFPFPSPRNRRSSSVTIKSLGIEASLPSSSSKIIDTEDNLTNFEKIPNIGEFSENIKEIRKKSEKISNDSERSKKILEESEKIRENLEKTRDVSGKIPDGSEKNRDVPEKIRQVPEKILDGLEKIRQVPEKILDGSKKNRDMSEKILDGPEEIQNEFEKVQQSKNMLESKKFEKCDKIEFEKEKNDERLLMAENEKSTLLKAKSCGAGLDSDDSYSQEYKPVIKGQGSLLSLPNGAETKRKRNFMDKCVNKVRSFIKKND